MDMKKALKQQQNEINDYALYMALAKVEKEPHNKELFEKIALEELSHYRFWKDITSVDLQPQRWLISFYLLLTKFFGTSFTLKLVEQRERWAEDFYRTLFDTYPQAKEIYAQENTHEHELINMLKDKKLLYAGAVVLGMNDALVELTGTLSGIAFAFDRSEIVGITGTIMGIAASLSMGGSAYLEARETSETSGVVPLKYALYTGIAYIVTTFFLVIPFFIFERIPVALVVMFIAAFISIVFYNFYIAVAKDESFTKRAFEMSLITFGVALISFAIGYVVKNTLGIEI